ATSLIGAARSAGVINCGRRTGPLAGAPLQIRRSLPIPRTRDLRSASHAPIPPCLANYNPLRMVTRARRIAVIGAGIGGLTFAIAARQYSLDVEIYEQTAELREVGAAVALSANAT